jgi:phosphatidylserine synthase
MNKYLKLACGVLCLLGGTNFVIVGILNKNDMFLGVPVVNIATVLFGVMVLLEGAEKVVKFVFDNVYKE